jgi:hypothetical protein
VDEEGGNKESANRSRDLFIFFDALLFMYRTGVYSKYDLWLEGGEHCLVRHALTTVVKLNLKNGLKKE